MRLSRLASNQNPQSIDLPKVHSDANTSVERILSQVLQRCYYPFVDETSERIKIKLLLAILNPKLAFQTPLHNVAVLGPAYTVHVVDLRCCGSVDIDDTLRSCRLIFVI